ncbi:hypothetical protein BDV12DRAFT_162399 [Aspergillus spectabilis]
MVSWRTIRTSATWSKRQSRISMSDSARVCCPSHQQPVDVGLNMEGICYRINRALAT